MERYFYKNESIYTLSIYHKSVRLQYGIFTFLSSTGTLYNYINFPIRSGFKPTFNI